MFDSEVLASDKRFNSCRSGRTLDSNLKEQTIESKHVPNQDIAHFAETSWMRSNRMIQRVSTIRRIWEQPQSPV